MKTKDLSAGNPLAELSGDLWDVEFDVKANGAKQVELAIRGSKAVIDVPTQTLHWGDKSVALPMNNGRFKLRALIDRSSVELFGNDGAVSFSACYLPKVDDHSISLNAVGGAATARSIVVRSLKSTWR